jgi:hypothetical protein
MFPSSLEIEFSKDNLLEKDNNLMLPVSDNFFSSSPLLLDYQNEKKAEKYINYFYTNSPFSSINDEIIDQYAFIKPIEKEINNKEETKKEIKTIKENNKEKLDNKKEANEEVRFIMINKTDDIDISKLTHVTSYGCLNSTSNVDKNINKKINLFTIKKYEKKRDSTLDLTNEENIGKNNILQNKRIKINKKYDLQKSKFDVLRNNNKIDIINFLKKKRKKRKNDEEEKIKNSGNVLFNNNVKENNYGDNDETIKENKLSLKEKFKNLRIQIPKNNNKINILPISQKVQIPLEINSNVINYNTFSNLCNGINNNIKEKDIYIKNNNYNYKQNFKENNYDINMAKIQKSSIKNEREKKSYIPQIFESQAPSIKINGLEYTTVLVPKKYIEKIKFSNI